MTDDIDFRILGDDMQIVEIGLDPGETVIAEAGAMNYMDEGIAFESVMGDGTKPPGGFWDQALGAGKRVLAGESLFLTHFKNTGSAKKTIAFAAPYPGRSSPSTSAHSAATSRARRIPSSARRRAQNSTSPSRRTSGSASSAARDSSSSACAARAGCSCTPEVQL